MSAVTDNLLESRSIAGPMGENLNRLFPTKVSVRHSTRGDSFGGFDTHISFDLVRVCAFRVGPHVAVARKTCLTLRSRLPGQEDRSIGGALKVGPCHRRKLFDNLARLDEVLEGLLDR